MITLLEAINRGILKGLSENNINLLTDLDDNDLDQIDSLQTKSVNSKLTLRYFPKTKEELIEIIKVEVEKKGWNCSLNHIDVSKITDMSNLFSINPYEGYNLDKFNGDISSWDVSNVTNMKGMFVGAKLFNQPIGDWDVSKVTNMNHMFHSAKTFNQPIGDWDVSNLTNTDEMFCGAKSFKQDLSKWKLKTNCRTYKMFNSTCPIKKVFKPKGIKVKGY